MLSIVIPSKNELFLERTIRDVLEKARGDIEIFPIIDGYEPPEYVDDKRVKYIKFRSGMGKRYGMNAMASVASGEFLMTLDAHCMMAEGFDVQLANDHGGDDWVQIPRRHRLDAENWSLQPQSDTRPPIDYEYIIYPPKFEQNGFHGFKWDDRTIARAHIPIDDTITFQGSCWFMHRDHFKRNGFMDYRYQHWGQEAEEVSFTTWTTGGRVVTNKNTWYAHLHKGTKFGRMYHLSRDMTRRSYEYSWNRWHADPKFHELVEKFWPLPGWPEDWKQELISYTWKPSNT